ncbi:MAG: NfeD family protein [Puniceicoccaceae bacterium]
MKRLSYLPLFLLAFSAGLSPAGSEPSAQEPAAESELGLPAAESDIRQVYILPVQGQITTPTFYILRRGLKLAEEQGIQTVVIDMDTPGGGLGPTLEIMEAFNSFKGDVFTFVNSEAVSAGAFISVASDRIYFRPDGIIGAAEAVAGSGQEIPEGMQRKIKSYIQAKVRVLTEEYRYRADVMRAMSDPNFVFEIDGEVIKDEGELLSLTASEAMETYGDPPQALLGAGIHDSIDDLLDDVYGSGNYKIRSFEVTWSESLAHYLNTVSPLLLGVGMLLLFIEFKTPGFGFIGIGGIILLSVVFISSHIAGLAGYEAILLFFIGLALVFVEIFLLPGLVFPALIGIFLVLGSLVWAMADIWPDEPIDWTGGTFTEPLLNMLIGMGIAVAGAVFLVRFLPKTWIWNKLVLQTAVGSPHPVPQGGADRANRPPSTPPGWPDIGREGVAVTDLFPNGEVEIGGKRFQAKSRLGQVEHGTRIRVTGYQDFALAVEPLPPDFSSHD